MPCGGAGPYAILGGDGGGGGRTSLDITIIDYITNIFNSFGLTGCSCTSDLLAINSDNAFHAAFLVLSADPTPQQIVSATTRSTILLAPLWTGRVEVVVVRDDLPLVLGVGYDVFRYLTGSTPVGSFDTLVLTDALTVDETLTLYPRSIAAILPIKRPGDLIVGDSDGSPSPLPLGTNNDMVLATESGAAEWMDFETLWDHLNPMTAHGDLLVGTTTTPGHMERVPIGTTNGMVLTVNAGDVVWMDAATVVETVNPMTSQGDMIIGGASPAGVMTRLPVDTAGKFLVLAGTPPVPTWLTLVDADSGGGGGGAPKRVPFLYLPGGTYASQTPNTTTHTVTTGCTRVDIELWGGGGGGSGASFTRMGGGGGAYVWATKVVSGGDVLNLYVPGNADKVNGEAATVNTTEIVAGGGVAATGSGTPGTGGVGSGTAAADSFYWMVGSDGTGPGSSFVTGGAAQGGNAPKGGEGAFSLNVGTENFILTPPTWPGGGGMVYKWTGVNLDLPGAAGFIIIWEYQ